MLGLNWLDEPDCLLSLPRVSSLGRKLSLITQSGAIFARSPSFLLGQTCPEGGFGAARWQGQGAEGSPSALSRRGAGPCRGGGPARPERGLRGQPGLFGDGTWLLDGVFIFP